MSGFRSALTLLSPVIPVPQLLGATRVFAVAGTWWVSAAYRHSLPDPGRLSSVEVAEEAGRVGLRALNLTCIPVR